MRVNVLVLDRGWLAPIYSKIVSLILNYEPALSDRFVVDIKIYI